MNTYDNYLLLKTKKELTRLAKLHRMSGYSSLNKEALAEKLLEYIYRPSVMHDFLVYLGDDETQLFSSPSRSSLKQTHQVYSGRPALYRRLLESGYCYKDTDGKYQFSSGLREFSSSRTFRKEQQRKSFLLDCVNAAGYLYGSCPVTILLKMYNTNTDLFLKKEEIVQELQAVPPYFHSFILENDWIIQKSLYKNDLYKKIQQCQGTLPFNIPDKETILHLSRFGYFPEDPYTKQLINILTYPPEISREEAQEISGEIQAVFRQGGTIEDALVFLKNRTASASASSGFLQHILTADMSDASRRRLLSALNSVFAHSALLLNRGYTAAEAMQLNKKRTKIYPNSPCPCGSGKKYKNCCGRR